MAEQCKLKIGLDLYWHLCLIFNFFLFFRNLDFSWITVGQISGTNGTKFFPYFPWATHWRAKWFGFCLFVKIGFAFFVPLEQISILYNALISLSLFLSLCPFPFPVWSNYLLQILSPIFTMFQKKSGFFLAAVVFCWLSHQMFLFSCPKQQPILTNQILFTAARNLGSFFSFLKKQKIYLFCKWKLYF